MRTIGIAGLVAALLTGVAAAQPAPPDYSRPETWVCRPGREQACTTGLDAMRVDGQGNRTPAPFVAAADPPIDCFYVYPTTSEETTPYADMVATPAVVRTVHGQAGRLASRCRLFAPIYRQLTIAGLRADMSGGRTPDVHAAGPVFGPAYADVRAAWREYLAHDNQGRGVVLIGHSQGSIMLQQLIADEIDGKPTQRLLVAAFLAGDPVLPVPRGQVVGGVFKSVPLCASASQTGCAYAWSSYAAGDTGDRLFADDPGGGLVAACVNPAAAGGGAAPLDAFFTKPKMAPDTDPPYVEVVGQLSGECVRDARGDVLRVTILPGKYDQLLSGLLARVARPRWGLHGLDVSLTQGNILADIDAEIRSWTAQSR